jgi:hypothetical protein
MRLLMLVSMAALAALAACGGEAEKKPKAKAGPAVMPAGQWESSLEVTNFRRTDEGQPKLNMPNGTRATGAGCVPGGADARPPLDLFVGPEFENCRWAENFYQRNGRLVSSGTCRRDGVGEVEVTISADYTEDSFQGTAEMLTRLASDGDVQLGARIEGRRTGQCTPVAEGGNQAKAK